MFVMIETNAIKLRIYVESKNVAGELLASHTNTFYKLGYFLIHFEFLFVCVYKKNTRDFQSITLCDISAISTKVPVR